MMHTPVHIYWLLDMRPEVIAAGWHSGYPFYCGKTIKPPEMRLKQHQANAYRAPRRPVSVRIRACGRHIRIEVVYTVKSGEDWGAAERSWIACLRANFANVANAADGGAGFNGIVSSRKRKVVPPQLRTMRQKLRARRLKQLQRIELRLEEKRRFFESKGWPWPPQHGFGMRPNADKPPRQRTRDYVYERPGN